MFETVLIQNLALCSVIMDFTRSGAVSEQITAKQVCLTDLTGLFNCQGVAEAVTPRLQVMIFEMLRANIFVQDPTYLMGHTRFDYSVPIVEPSWPHLEWCFHVLLGFIETFPNSEVFTFEVAQRAVYLTQLPDLRERVQLTSFLRSYVNTHATTRDRFARLLAKQLLDVLDEAALPFCCDPLIVLFGHLVGCYGGINDLLTQVFCISVLPLIRYRYFPLFCRHLTKVLNGLLTTRTALIGPTLRAIEKYWSQTDSAKQGMILEMLIAIVGAIPQPLFESLAQRFFKFIAACLLLPNLKVIDLILDLWIEEPVKDWMKNNVKCAMVAMLANVSVLADKFWFPTANEKATRAVVAMAKLDSHTFRALRDLQKQAKAQSAFSAPPTNDCQRRWAAVLDLAAKRGDDGNAKVKKHEIHYLFHNERPETLAPTHFLVPTAIAKASAEKK
jgi:hypothetical protein